MQLHDLATWFLFDTEVSVHLFTPFKGINTRDYVTTNLVGFDKDHVFSFSSPEGSKARPPFDYDNICVDFALQVCNVALLSNRLKREHIFMLVFMS